MTSRNLVLKGGLSIDQAATPTATAMPSFIDDVPEGHHVALIVHVVHERSARRTLVDVLLMAPVIAPRNSFDETTDNLSCGGSYSLFFSCSVHAPRAIGLLIRHLLGRRRQKMWANKADRAAITAPTAIAMRESLSFAPN